MRIDRIAALVSVPLTWIAETLQSRDAIWPPAAQPDAVESEVFAAQMAWIRLRLGILNAPQRTRAKILRGPHPENVSDVMWDQHLGKSEISSLIRARQLLRGQPTAYRAARGYNARLHRIGIHAALETIAGRVRAGAAC